MPRNSLQGIRTLSTHLHLYQITQDPIWTMIWTMVVVVYGAPAACTMESSISCVHLHGIVAPFNTNTSQHPYSPSITPWSSFPLPLIATLVVLMTVMPWTGHPTYFLHCSPLPSIMDPYLACAVTLSHYWMYHPCCAMYSTSHPIFLTICTVYSYCTLHSLPILHILSSPQHQDSLADYKLIAPIIPLICIKKLQSYKQYLVCHGFWRVSRWNWKLVILDGMQWHVGS